MCPFLFTFLGMILKAMNESVLDSLKRKAKDKKLKRRRIKVKKKKQIEREKME